MHHLCMLFLHMLGSSKFVPKKESNEPVTTCHNVMPLSQRSTKMMGSHQKGYPIMSTISSFGTHSGPIDAAKLFGKGRPGKFASCQDPCFPRNRRAHDPCKMQEHRHLLSRTALHARQLCRRQSKIRLPIAAHKAQRACGLGSPKILCSEWPGERKGCSARLQLQNW